MKISLASLKFPESIEDGLCKIEDSIIKASQADSEIICFPESYIPGMRGINKPVEQHNPAKLKESLNTVCQLAKKFSINVIMPMDRDKNGNILNVAFVISDKGEILGMQTKNHLDPCEDKIFIAGTERNIFLINNVKIGIVICHEGFRYPESVRQLTYNGAQVIFHPVCTGNDTEGQIPEKWGDAQNTYHEKAMMCRALENGVFFLGINYAFKFQNAATCAISPEGKCLMHLPYNKDGILTLNLDVKEADLTLAKRFNPKLYYC